MRFRHAVDLLVLLVGAGVQLQLLRWLRQARFARYSTLWQLVLIAAALFSIGFLALGVALAHERVSRYLPTEFSHSIQALSYVWALYTSGVLALYALWRLRPKVSENNPERRWFLRTGAIAVAAVPAAVVGHAVLIQRTRMRPKEVMLRLPNLPRDLQGLRIAQLTDIHLSPYLTEQEFAPAIGIANEFRPHVTVITGDLITRPGDPLDACLRQLARLRAEAGVFGCMGNHEHYARTMEYTEQEGARLGMTFLRHRSVPLRFGAATLHVAGLDYQEMHRPYLVGFESFLQRGPETVNLLLQHNPDVFPVAAQQGWDITLAGHTHGGQVTVEYLEQYVNAARFFTPFVNGTYERGGRLLYVSEGIGTVGLPARLGTEAEVTLVTLARG